MDERLIITRPQRVVILAAVMLTSLAINALFFGENPSGIDQKVIVALISSFIMV